MPRASSTPTSDASTPLPAQLLLIDGFSLKLLRVLQDEDFHDLVAARNTQGATIVTSNLVFSKWGDAFPARLLGVPLTGSDTAPGASPRRASSTALPDLSGSTKINCCQGRRNGEIIAPSVTPDQCP